MAGPGDKGEFDYVVQLDSEGNIVGASSGGTSMTDDGAFTPGSSSVTPIGAVYQATPDNVDDNDIGVPRMTQARILLVDASGATVPISNAGLTELAAAINGSSQLDVNIAASGATVPISHAALTELAAAIDTEVQVDIVSAPTLTVNAHAVTNAGTFAVQVDGAALTALQNADADLTTIIGHVDGIEGLIGTTNTNTGNAATSLGVMDDWDNGASDGASVSGDVAHDSADAGEPVKIGFRAFSPDGTTPGTAVAENDRSNGKSDLDGRQYVNGTHPNHWTFHSDGSSALTDQSVAADPGDGFQLVITSIVFSNGSTTAMNIFLEEGASKILGPWYLEGVSGRGLVWQGEKYVTASTALTVTTSADRKSVV